MTRIINVAHDHRRLLVVGLHLVLICLSSYAAMWLRFDGDIPEENWTPWLYALPSVVAIRAATFLPLRLYEGLWRYTSIWDLRNILIGILGSSLISYLWIHEILGLSRYPRSVFIIDAVLLVCLMGGIRLSRRVSLELRATSTKGRRVLIYGAGNAGEMIVRDMRLNPTFGAHPVGFVDDDRRKVGQRIHGVPVLGTRHSLPEMVERERPAEVLIAMPSAMPAELREVVRVLQPYKVRITTLPSLKQIVDGPVQIDQIRNLQLEDLLPRAPVGLDQTRLTALVSSRRVLVTGAGGSIGSELCRQIARLTPARLVMLDRYENSLYAIEQAIADGDSGCQGDAVVADVTDAQRVHEVFSEFRPHIVFHAAAHKHVPLMEANPCEAVKNNVRGSRLLIEAAVWHGVQTFILISSDKAVNPTSVMGATKRLSELLLRAANGDRRTKFSAVRFGNVLGSNGSVVPRFLEQIRTGGPVTVTHPEIRRYFMLIPEAVHLVLHAAALQGQAPIYVLDMGEQVKMVELARHLISLSGFVPDDEIRITFTGLRPGEKLFEELIGKDESAEPSAVPKILCVRGGDTYSSSLELRAVVGDLERLAMKGNRAGVVDHLRRLVPTLSRPAEEVVH